MAMDKKRAMIVLEDGNVFHGYSIGEAGEVTGEVVFNTGMTGYQEVLTDPSYCGQIVTMTYPLIGNYGAIYDDEESYKVHVKGYIIREMCDYPMNFRLDSNLDEYLKSHNIIGIEGVDTRALTKILREKGTMNGILTTNMDIDIDEKMKEIHEYTIKNPVDEVSVKESEFHEGNGEGKKYRVSLLDLGLKRNIIRSLQKRNCDVHVFPAWATAEEVLSVDPDGIMLSNGPGDPKDCEKSIDTIKNLMGKRPMFGICLGHQLTALACDGDTEKLKYGHRGANHPVKDIKKDRTYITSQNHGYTIIEDSLDKNKMEVTHINMNDGTVEGIKYLNSNVVTVQFHPEASPGPKDTAYLFDEFLMMMDKGGKNA
jgi:carbamoyl-phosphate synthase small subunit